MSQLTEITQFIFGQPLSLKKVGSQGKSGSRLAIFGALIEEVRFARDSPLEGTGFEISVPRELRFGFEASSSAVPGHCWCAADLV